jgi:hypothetical protein
VKVSLDKLVAFGTRLVDIIFLRQHMAAQFSSVEICWVEICVCGAKGVTANGAKRPEKPTTYFEPVSRLKAVSASTSTG